MLDTAVVVRQNKRKKEDTRVLNLPFLRKQNIVKDVAFAQCYKNSKRNKEEKEEKGKYREERKMIEKDDKEIFNLESFKCAI